MTLICLKCDNFEAHQKLKNFYFQRQIHKYFFAQNMPVCALLKPQFRNFYYIGKYFSPFSGQTQTTRHAKIPVGTRFNLDL